MIEPGSQHPDRDADLDAAYARAHALADDGRGPSASVRANVLAAAQEVAAQGRATPPLAPVAAPVSAVGRGRAMAVNLSSWRVRSGAAVCAALLVALGVWRFDANHRADGGVQVATASLELAQPPAIPLARDLPVPPLAAASTPYVAPPPVVEDPVARMPAANMASAKQAPHDKDRDVIVAQADSADRVTRPAAAPPEARAEARRATAPAPAAPPVRLALDAAAPAPAPMAPEAPVARAPAQRPDTPTLAAAAAPPQLATMPPMPPSVLPRRVVVAPEAGATSVADAKAAEPAPQRVQVTGSSLRRVELSEAAPARFDAAKPSLAAHDRQPPATLQSAADRGDVEALKALLADPAARVDAPDPAGRTALLHAVLAQQAAAVRLLVAAGADPARADQAGLTPRAAAQAGANAEIAGLLAAPR